MSERESEATTNSDSVNIEVGSRAGGDVQTKGVEIVGEFVTAVTAMLTAAGGMKMLLEMVTL